MDAVISPYRKEKRLAASFGKARVARFGLFESKKIN